VIRGPVGRKGSEVREIVHQLGLNENCSPPLPGVPEAIAGAARSAARTGDPLAAGLAGTIAGRIGEPPERVLAGAGSAALLQQFLYAHAGPGGTVLHADPSWEMYPLLIRNSGAEPVGVAGSGWATDFAALAAAVDERTRVVLVCNPNNPTGEVTGHATLAAFAAALPPRVLVLVDEAYREFAGPGTVADAQALAAADPRIAVVRTFSKSHGLLGLRVGYLVGAEPVLAPVRASGVFFRVPTVAQAAALAALDAADAVREQCAQVAAERDRVRAGLLDLGVDVPPSGGNFLWLRLGERNEEFAGFLAGHGIAVRVIGAGIRVSTGSPEANDAVLACAKEFRG
jgi:histidinol-phosphate aminotransferase